MSGLQVGGRHDPLLVSLLFDFISGYLGGEEDQKKTSARYDEISRKWKCLFFGVPRRARGRTSK